MGSPRFTTHPAFTFLEGCVEHLSGSRSSSASSGSGEGAASLQTSGIRRRATGSLLAQRCQVEALRSTTPCVPGSHCCHHTPQHCRFPSPSSASGHYQAAQTSDSLSLQHQQPGDHLSCHSLSQDCDQAAQTTGSCSFLPQPDFLGLSCRSTRIRQVSSHAQSVPVEAQDHPVADHLSAFRLELSPADQQAAGSVEAEPETVNFGQLAGYPEAAHLNSPSLCQEGQAAGPEIKQLLGSCQGLAGQICGVSLQSLVESRDSASHSCGQQCSETSKGQHRASTAVSQHKPPQALNSAKASHRFVNTSSSSSSSARCANNIGQHFQQKMAASTERPGLAVNVSLGDWNLRGLQSEPSSTSSQHVQAHPGGSDTTASLPSASSPVPRLRQTRSGAVPWTVHDPGHIQSPRSQRSLNGQLSNASLVTYPSLSPDLEPAISIAARASHTGSHADQGAALAGPLEDLGINLAAAQELAQPAEEHSEPLHVLATPEPRPRSASLQQALEYLGTPDTGNTHSSSSTEAPPGCTPPRVAVQQQVASSPVLQLVEAYLHTPPASPASSRGGLSPGMFPQLTTPSPRRSPSQSLLHTGSLRARFQQPGFDQPRSPPSRLAE
ncbi:hypothetical protein WJX74_003518, partial [Apatococcus lobatus]